jgi:hypothetical protein
MKFNIAFLALFGATAIFAAEAAVPTGDELFKRDAECFPRGREYTIGHDIHLQLINSNTIDRLLCQARELLQGKLRPRQSPLRLPLLQRLGGQ